MGETWSGEFAPQQMQGIHHSWVDWCGDDVGGKPSHCWMENDD